MTPITKAQITKLHILLNQFGIMDDKAELVQQFTNGRETSSTKMSLYEAKNLLMHLSQFDPLDKMRKKVFALAYVAGIIYGDTPDDRKINVAKLNMFLKKNGSVKKELNKMSKDELVKTVSQFGQIIKHNENAQISKATKSMLTDIGISTMSNKAVKSI